MCNLYTIEPSLIAWAQEFERFLGEEMILSAGADTLANQPWPQAVYPGAVSSTLWVPSGVGGLTRRPTVKEPDSGSLRKRCCTITRLSKEKVPDLI